MEIEFFKPFLSVAPIALVQVPLQVLGVIEGLLAESIVESERHLKVGIFKHNLIFVGKVAARGDLFNLWVVLQGELDCVMCCVRQCRHQNQATDDAPAQRVYHCLPLDVEGWHFHAEVVHSGDNSTEAPLLFPPTVAIVTYKFPT